MDGNFSAEHMKSRCQEADAPLSAGMGFMANPDRHRQHMRSGHEIVQAYPFISLDGIILIRLHIGQHMQHIQGHRIGKLTSATLRHHRYRSDCLLSWVLCTHLSGRFPEGRAVCLRSYVLN